jgi:hypothetical protein
MNARRYCVFVAVVAMVVGIVRPGFADDDRYVHQCAREAAAEGDRNGAFSFYHSLLRSGEGSPYYHDALFAAGEYYFWNADYRDSCEVFTALINCYPGGKAPAVCRGFSAAHR